MLIDLRFIEQLDSIYLILHFEFPTVHDAAGVH
jgi:hypothetical protein